MLGSGPTECLLMVGVFSKFKFHNGDVFPAIGEGGAEGEVRPG